MTTLAEYISEYISDNISESIISSTHTGKTGIDEELKKHGLNPDKATLNADGSVDYDGDVRLMNHNLTRLPFKFNRVTGYFDISLNPLTSLDGSPRYVGDNFLCARCNRLTSLEGSPDVIAGGYKCVGCDLTSLKGMTQDIGDYVWVSDNKLRSLAGCPNVVKGAMYVDGNQLTTLKGGPERVESSMFVNYTAITSLEGAPKYIATVLDCSENSKLVSLKGAEDIQNDNLAIKCSGCSVLKSLEGCPREIFSLNAANCGLTTLYGSPDVVKHFFDVSNNQLTSLMWAPVLLSKAQNFKCSGNKVKFSRREVERVITAGPHRFDDIK